MSGKGASTLICHGCGWRGSPGDPAVLACPASVSGDGVDHVVVRVLDPVSVAYPAGGEANPFIRYRTLLHAYHAARQLGCGDGDFVGLVERLDRQVALVDGHGFRVTTFGREAALSERLGFGTVGGVWVKDETRNVSGSHKARHLFGTMLELEVADAVRAGECPDPDRAAGPAPLAIASCGNAALAAAVVARAADRHLDVFIPPDADPAVVSRLRELGANLEICEREPGVSGDPTYLRLLRALDEGAAPFTCQGNLNGLAIEGGETLAWEMIDALQASHRRIDRVFVQVGGGALASAIVEGFADACALGVPVDVPRIHAVQTRAAYPLARAYGLLAARLLGRPVGDPPSAADLDALQLAVMSEAGRATLDDAACHRADFMWAWETAPHSVAHGILDDETYDWLAVLTGMLETRGHPVVVDEATLERANALARATTEIAVDHTGSSGLAGLIALRSAGVVGSNESVAVLFTGVDRTSVAAPAIASVSAPVSTPVTVTHSSEE